MVFNFNWKFKYYNAIHIVNAKCVPRIKMAKQVRKTQFKKSRDGLGVVWSMCVCHMNVCICIHLVLWCCCGERVVCWVAVATHQNLNSLGSEAAGSNWNPCWLPSPWTASSACSKKYFVINGFKTQLVLILKTLV